MSYNGLYCVYIGAVLSKYLLTNIWNIIYYYVPANMDQICGVSVYKILFRYCMKRNIIRTEI